MSNWKGLAAALNDSDDTAEDAGVAPHEPSPTTPPPTTPASAKPPTTRRTRPQPTNADSAAPTTPARSHATRRAKPGQPRFVDTHRMVGIWFPFALDEAMRDAAHKAGKSNSAYVVAAVEAFIKERR